MTQSYEAPSLLITYVPMLLTLYNVLSDYKGVLDAICNKLLHTIAKLINVAIK